MGRDNKDRYGYRHRNDPGYEMGEASPGDVGDSKGTFHDRARQNSNVIVDGKVRSQEAHNRSSVDESSEKKRETSSKTKSESVSQDSVEGTVVELSIDSNGGTLDAIARYKNHQVHIEGGSPGETIKVKLEKGQGYLIGRRVKVRE